MKWLLPRSKRHALGIGLGFAVAGALALVSRYGFRRGTRLPLPEDFSPAVFSRRLASTAHGEIVYQISGSGEPVVFLHGIYPGASSFEWSRVYPRFAIDREVLAADLVGFGESERPARRMDASDHAESLADFLLETCEGRRPVVVASGNSCPLALLLASRHPERLAALALLAPQAGKARWASPALVLAARVRPLGHFLYDYFMAREPFLRTWVSRFGFADASRAGDHIPQVLAACAQQTGAAHATLAALRGSLGVDLRARLERVPHPVNVLAPHGSHGAELAAKLPNGRWIEIPPCGELAALELPDAVAEALAPLLNGPQPAGGS